MEKHTLKIHQRTLLGRKVKALRRQGQVPGNIFGKNIKSEAIQTDAMDFAKVYQAVGESTLVYLKTEGSKEDRPVLVREVTRDPVSGQVLHVAFNQVSLKEKITAPVSIKITGEAAAEKEKMGIMVQQLHEVEVEALPTDMPENISVDVASLAAVDDMILVKDLVLDAKVTVKTDPEAIVVKIEKLAAEEKVEAPAAVEGEVPAEGTEAAPVAETPTEAPASAEKTAE